MKTEQSTQLISYNPVIILTFTFFLYLVRGNEFWHYAPQTVSVTGRQTVLTP